MKALQPPRRSDASREWAFAQPNHGLFATCVAPTVGHGVGHGAGRKHPAQRGFSLLEILVAFAIAAMALGLLYRVSGNNARQAGGLIQHERAMVLAQSLLAAHQTVPPWGLSETGDASGYVWRVDSQPYPTAATDADPSVTPLHEVQVQVSWADGQAMRHFGLSSLRPERRLLPGEEEGPAQ